MANDEPVVMKQMVEINDALTPHIQELKNKRIVEVSEAVFRHKLLPLAVARYSNVEGYEDINMTTWQMITGESPMYGVRVMRNGKELFVTPPLILAPEVTYEGESLLTRLKEIENEQKMGLPKRESLDADAMKPTVRTRGLADALKCWVHIFLLYGIRLVPIDSEDEVATDKEEVAKEAATEEPTTNTRMVQYDDDEDGGPL